MDCLPLTLTMPSQAGEAFFDRFMLASPSPGENRDPGGHRADLAANYCAIHSNHHCAASPTRTPAAPRENVTTDD